MYPREGFSRFVPWSQPLCEQHQHQAFAVGQGGWCFLPRPEHGKKKKKQLTVNQISGCCVETESEHPCFWQMLTRSPHQKDQQEGANKQLCVTERKKWQMGRKTICITAGVQPLWGLPHAVLLLRQGDQSASPLMSIEMRVTLPVDFIRLCIKLWAAVMRGKKNTLTISKHKQTSLFHLHISAYKL